KYGSSRSSRTRRSRVGSPSRSAPIKSEERVPRVGREHVVLEVAANDVRGAPAVLVAERQQQLAQRAPAGPEGVAVELVLALRRARQDLHRVALEGVPLGEEGHLRDD